MAKKDLKTAGQEGSQLARRLSDYGAITGISAAAKTLHRRTGNWPIYAAATGSALAMATGASASIITSGVVWGTFPSGVSVNPAGPYTQLGLIPGLSVKIHAASTALGPQVQLQMQATNENLFFSPIQGYAKNFGFKSPIGPGLSTGVGPTEIVAAFFTGHAYGNFAAAQPGFVGLSFSTVAHANIDYGWIELEFRNNAQGIPYYLQALAFGIDTNPGQTPGTLLAGEINGGFIPEPSTLSLAILASGAAGVMALRRRRKRAAAS